KSAEHAPAEGVLSGAEGILAGDFGADRQSAVVGAEPADQGRVRGCQPNQGRARLVDRQPKVRDRVDVVVGAHGQIAHDGPHDRQLGGLGCYADLDQVVRGRVRVDTRDIALHAHPGPPRLGRCTRTLLTVTWYPTSVPNKRTFRLDQRSPVVPEPLQDHYHDGEIPHHKNDGVDPR